MIVALAATHHDPDGLLYDQTARMLPLLQEIYCHMTVVITPTTQAPVRTLLHDHNVSVVGGDANSPSGHLQLGFWRRFAVEHALRDSAAATHIHFCDFDRVLHWIEFYPAELKAVQAELIRYDFTVLGRTPRAFASHPRIQRDTEGIVNHVFQQTSGLPWDVTAASRGLSRQATQAIVAECHDNTIGSDCSWPLFLQAQGGFALGYQPTEGLEFETLDRYSDELAALGGADAWIARVDNDPQNWAFRLEMARVEVEAIVAYRQ